MEGGQDSVENYLAHNVGELSMVEQTTPPKTVISKGLCAMFARSRNTLQVCACLVNGTYEHLSPNQMKTVKL